MREIRRVQISVYKYGGEIPKIVKDIPCCGNAPESLLKASATRSLRATTNEPMSAWQQTHEMYPEWFREAGSFRVYIHKLTT